MINLRKLILLSASGLILTACADTEGSDENDLSTESSTVQQESIDSTQEETDVDNADSNEDELPREINLNEELHFTNFTIEMEEAIVYEEDDQTYLDFKLTWTNDSFDGERTLLAATAIEAHQGDQALQETSGVISNPNSNYYYRADVGIWTPVEFTYELTDDSTPVRIVFVTMEPNEENQEYIINLEEN